MMAHLDANFFNDAPESVRNDPAIRRWVMEKFRTGGSRKLQRRDTALETLEAKNQALQREIDMMKEKLEKFAAPAHIQCQEHAEEIRRLRADNARYKKALEMAKKQGSSISRPSRFLGASPVAGDGEHNEDSPTRSATFSSATRYGQSYTPDIPMEVDLAVQRLDRHTPNIQQQTKSSQIDVEAMKPQEPRPGLKLPQFEGECEARLCMAHGSSAAHRKPLPDSPMPTKVVGSSLPIDDSNQPDSDCNGVKYRRVISQAGKVILLLPTPEQYRDLKKADDGSSPLLYTVAETLGARGQGVFMIEIPPDCRPELPKQVARETTCTTYTSEKLDSFWRLYTKKATSKLPFLDVESTKDKPDLEATIVAYHNRIAESSKRQDSSLVGIAYQTDIPANTASERKHASLPQESPIWPIRGNKLPQTGIAGVHTPTGYRGTPFSPFAWHFEDMQLGALNLLYYGRKVWFVTNPSFFNQATKAFANLVKHTSDAHSQFLRHEALHCGAEHLRQQGVPTIGFLQKPWQIVVVYPRAYHSGFSATATLAEAVNYADLQYTLPKDYKSCSKKCQPSDPITAELVFPKERHRQGATIRCLAPTTIPQNSPKRKRSGPRPARKACQEAKFEKEQNESEDDLHVQPSAKRKMFSWEQLAADLLENAEERIKNHISALIEHSDVRLPASNMNEAHEYLSLGQRWDEHTQFSAMVALTLNTRGLELLYNSSFPTEADMYDKAGKLGKLSSNTIEELREKLHITEPALKTKLSRLRIFLKLGLEYLPFIPPIGVMSKDRDKPSFRNFERLNDGEVTSLRQCIKQNKRARHMATIGRIFRLGIIKGGCVSIWTDIGLDNIHNMSLEELSNRLENKQS